METKWRDLKERKVAEDLYDREQLQFDPINWSKTLKWTAVYFYFEQISKKNLRVMHNVCYYSSLFSNDIVANKHIIKKIATIDLNDNLGSQSNVFGSNLDANIVHVDFCNLTLC